MYLNCFARNKEKQMPLVIANQSQDRAGRLLRQKAARSDNELFREKQMPLVVANPSGFGG
jgi:hypothetical protein